MQPFIDSIYYLGESRVLLLQIHSSCADAPRSTPPPGFTAEAKLCTYTSLALYALEASNVLFGETTIFAGFSYSLYHLFFIRTIHHLFQQTMISAEVRCILKYLCQSFSSKIYSSYSLHHPKRLRVFTTSHRQWPHPHKTLHLAPRYS